MGYRFACSVMAVVLASACGDSSTPNSSTANSTTPSAGSPTRRQVNYGAGSSGTRPDLVSRAEKMLLEHGVTIADVRGDWMWTGHREDNPFPYPVPFADLTAVTFAVDGDYLYVRLTVGGPYPTTEGQLPWYGRDQIRKLNVNIGLDTDNNEDTGSLVA